MNDNMAGIRNDTILMVVILGIICAGCVEGQFDVVGTVPRAMLQQGSEGLLPCTVQGNPSRVTWRKGDTDAAADTLVTLDSNGAKSGEGYDDGSHDITGSYSLLINNVEVRDEGRYICEVTIGTTPPSSNYTTVTVYAPPLEPFPRADDCMEQADSSQSCIAYTDGEYRNLTCYALQFYPTLHLSFTRGSEPIDPIATEEIENTDGTKTKSVTIRAEVSEEPYECIASGIPGQQSDRVLEVIVKPGSPTSPPDSNNGSKDIIMIVLLTLLGLLCLAIAGCMLAWRCRRRRNRYRGVPKGDNERGKTGGCDDASASNVNNEDMELQVIPRRAEEVPVAPLSTQNHITDEELKRIADQLTGRHCRRLSEELGPKTSLLQVKAIEVVIRENEGVLFDVHLILKRYLEKQRGDDDDKRRRLLQTAQKIGREDLTDFKCIDDEELRQLIKTVDSDSLKNNVCEILGVKYDYDDDDNDFFQKLCDWRIGKSDSGLTVSTAERYRRFQNAIKNINVSKSSSFPFKRQVFEDRELYELSSQLLLHDLRPFTSVLGIAESDLADGSQPFNEKNMAAGTMCLMKELYHQHDKNWEKMCKVLKNMGYYQAAQMGLSGNYAVE